MDSTRADRRDRRTTLVAREFGRYNIHIAVLGETRFANEGQLKAKLATPFSGAIATVRIVEKQEWALLSKQI